ncbi:MAG: TetR/AcrR family transcriptional regulator [Flavipsychrobacter sp.]|nr:TetR/AcrR family transcriptional regulator [Flavipsychrobacter sp.]
MMDNNERILLAAKDLFFKFGLKNVTMDDISRELGMSKKTLYENYQNKKDIVETITQRFLDRHHQEYENMASQAVDAVDEVVRLMDKFSMLFEKMHPRIIFDMQRYYPESWQMFKDYKLNFVLLKIRENLDKGIIQGLYRANIDPEVISRLHLEQIQIAIDPLILPPEQFGMKHIHRQLLLQYLYGISTVKGHILINQYLDFNDISYKIDL